MGPLVWCLQRAGSLGVRCPLPALSSASSAQQAPDKRIQERRGPPVVPLVAALGGSCLLYTSPSPRD
eukprot:4992766-Alexandrium_andersonii.AAC.1